jgi:hypothetical protein
MTDEQPWPWRMLLSGNFETAWRTAAHEEREQAYVRLITLHRRWQNMGARLICTIDNLGNAGQPPAGEANFYSVWEIPSPAIVQELIDPFWHGDGDLPLTAHFSVRLTVGKPIISMERDLGGTETATSATSGAEMKPVP